MRRQELHPRTAVINKTQKNQSKRDRHQALAWLAVTFPESFDNTLRIRPLKTGIMHDILAYADKAEENGISRSKLREAVVVFTRRLDYLACLKAREMRIDLLGNPCTQVTEEEAEKAACKIKKRIEKTVRNIPKVVSSTNRPSTNAPNKTESLRSSAAYHQPIQDFNGNGYERPPAFSATPAKPVATVAVRHKTSRQYDPDAVARLKEKLGLSRKNAVDSDAIES